jgi:hypothetical protein
VLCAASTLLLCKATPWTRRHAYIVRSCRKASKHQPSEVGSFSYWFDKPWFHTEGRLAVVLIITFSWGFQLGGHLQNSYINTAPPTSLLAPLPGRKKISARGVSHFQSFTLLLFCFILFYFYLHIFIKNTKKLVPLIVGIQLLLLLVYYVVP